MALEDVPRKIHFMSIMMSFSACLQFKERLRFGNNSSTFFQPQVCILKTWRFIGAHSGSYLLKILVLEAKLYNKDQFLRKWLFLLILIILWLRKFLLGSAVKYPFSLLMWSITHLSSYHIRRLGRNTRKCKFYSTASILSVIWNSKVELMVLS